VGLQQWTRTDTIDLAHESDWLKRAITKIDELAALEENWDGSGSRKVSEAAVRAAYNLASALAQQPLTQQQLPPTYILPSPTGGIQLEWHTPTKHLEIEALSDGGGEFLASTEEGFNVEGRLDVTNETSVAVLARWLTAAA
jgi:hypothetical protein